MTPILKTTHVPLSPTEAFDLFMAQLNDWWPKDRHTNFGPDTQFEIDARKNGTITEIAPDGTRRIWGRIIGWEPDEYMAFSWFPDGDEDAATIVAVSFTATADGTRLTLTHGGFEILGPMADAVSTSYLIGWDLTLGSYCYAASKTCVMA